ncbi:tetratricopeptide repeat protein [Candidatus Gottesmanbacteria bacterium]|nr:tetratricopeptide repeat protein [Candidatus Gottesmanbacteria bacterium]
MRRIFAFLAFLVFAVYLNSLGNDFVSDDIGTIRDNPLINKIDYIFYFRFNPTSVLNFLVHQLFGLNPLFYRFINILAHFGSAWLIFILLSLLQNPPVPLFAAAIFAVHPLLTESITWISGGVYCQSAFLILLSLLNYLLYQQNRKKVFLYLSSVALFVFAFLTNNKLIIFPLILFSYELSRKTLGNNWLKIVPYALVSLFGAFYLFGLLGPRMALLETSFYQQPGINNPFYQIPIAVTSYLQLIFWPKDLTLYHSEMSFTQTEFLIRFIIFITFIIFIIVSSFKNRPVFFWLSFFLIALLPTLTPWRVSWIVAERYVYLSSLGIFVAVAMTIVKLAKIFQNQRLSFFLLGIILALLSVRTIIRNADWKNQDTLWLATAKTSPSSPQNHNNLGDYYGRQGNLEKAVEEFKKAIELLPGYADAYHNLANTYQQMGRTQEALENYQKAVTFNPNLWQSYHYLSAIYFGEGKYDSALENLQKAITVNPQNANLYTNLGIVYLKMGEKQKAKEVFQKALNLDPGNTKLKQLLLSF